MIYTLDKIKEQIAAKINQALGEEMIRASDLVYPNTDLGDLSLPCFAIGKSRQRSPADIAAAVVNNFESGGYASGVKAVGPYLNFNLDTVKLAAGVIGEINSTAGKYGRNTGGRSTKVMIEYSNANTHKEFHVGHLRNLCYGDAVHRILDANGFKVIPVSYINDFGIHVAKTVWGYADFTKKFEEDNKGKKLEEAPASERGYLLGKMYQDSCRRADKDKSAARIIELVMKKIESRQGKEYELWEKTRQWSIDYYNEIYKDLDVSFAETYYESDLVDRGKELVDRYLAKGLLKRSDGAIIADLDKYGLGVQVFIRSDGTAMYGVADLALAEVKEKRAKQSIYVVDVRQSLHFRQLFKLLELAGNGQKKTHLGYEFVKLPTGMMASRTGHVITYRALRRDVLEQTRKETKDRHADWSGQKIEQAARTIANGAIKFEMLKVNASQVITFDINQALRFDGFTAAYLQYTHARISSITRKAGASDDSGKNKSRPQPALNAASLHEKKEAALVLKMAKYHEVVKTAGDNYDPSEITKYLFELAQNFNDYYHSVPVLKTDDKTRAARLALISAVRTVLKNGLGLLGIDAPAEM